MRPQPDASKAVCRVCGEVQSLATEARQAATDLASFTTAHSVHDRFRIDVVTGPVTESKMWRLPLQRCTSPTDDGARTA